MLQSSTTYVVAQDFSEQGRNYMALSELASEVTACLPLYSIGWSNSTKEEGNMQRFPIFQGEKGQTIGDLSQG